MAARDRSGPGREAGGDETRLSEGVRARDEDALRAVVDAYLPQLLRAALASGLGRERAEDVVQETFATFLEKAHTFRGESQVRTWLFGILYRKLLEAGRRTRREELHEDIESIVAARKRYSRALEELRKQLMKVGL